MSDKPLKENNIKRLEYISNFLKELRILNGMTQSELSKQTNIHTNTIQRAEQAKNFSLLSLFKIVDGLDIPLKDLFLDIE